MRKSGESIHKRLSSFAAYFGIVSAILALASWLTTNYFGNEAAAARNALSETRSAFDTSSGFRRVYEIVNEETQNLDHVYDLLRDVAGRLDQSLASSNEQRLQAKRYDEMKRWEYTRHMTRVMFDESERARQLAGYADVLNVDDAVKKRAANVLDALQKLADQAQRGRESFEAAVKTKGDLYALSETAWRGLTAEFARFHQLIEIDSVPAMNDASQRVSQLELEILGLQKREADRRARAARFVQTVAFTLYVVSALLAVYGKWLETKYPRPRTS